MKVSLALGREPLSRQTAWGCLTTNLALPGFGSLVAGRISGYPQVALTLGGMALTIIFGIRFVMWYFANISRFRDSETDIFHAFGEMWVPLRWPMLGFALFALGWIWALGTSILIIAGSKKTDGSPPVLGQH